MSQANERERVEAQAERLVANYADLILRLSYTYLGSTADAEDICQTVLLRLMTKAPRFQNEEHERAWVIRTTANACKDLLKSAARRSTVGLEAAGEVAAPDAPDGAVADAVSRLKDTLFHEGVWRADYVRLRGKAVKLG